MKYADIKAMMAEIAPVIREYTAAAVAPLSERLDAIEAQLASLPAPRDGKDADEDAIVERVTAKMAGEIAQLRASVDAIQIPEIPDVEGMIAEAVEGIEEQRAQDAAQVQSLIDGIEEKVATLDAKIEDLPEPKDGRDGADGKSVTIEDVLPALEKRVDEFLAAIPMPKDGEPGPKGEKGEPGRNGLDVKDMFRAEGGKLVAVMSDGTTRDLGVFVGKDGKDGEPGRDGVGFDDLDFDVRENGAFLRFIRGEEVKEIRLPIVMDRGVYSADKKYRKGDGVTWGGSFWIAQEDTSDKPDTGKGWRLAVKKGRDGRDK